LRRILTSCENEEPRFYRHFRHDENRKLFEEWRMAMKLPINPAPKIEVTSDHSEGGN
jgi:hypothetical protein